MSKKKLIMASKSKVGIRAVTNGTNGGDAIQGTGGNDTLNGLGGNDIIHANGGNDSVNGGTGNDLITGGAGSDTLVGNTGDDVFVQANDVSNDQIDGGSNTDLVRYGNFAITYNLTTGVVTRSGGSDTLVGIETIIAGTSLDTINAASETAHITVDLDDGSMSGVSPTFFRTVESFDRFFSGSGNDGITASSRLTGVTLKGGGGNDSILSGDGNDSLEGEAGDDELYGNPGNDSILGGDGDDTVDGGAGNDTLRGGDGHDDLFGSDDNDEFIMGESGGDTVDGGSGEDTVKYTAAEEAIYWDVEASEVMHSNGIGDYFDELGNIEHIMGSAFDDWVNVSDSYTGFTINLAEGTVSGTDIMFSGFENALGGYGNDAIAGDDEDNEIQGRLGSDTLIGGAGDDDLEGGQQRDFLSGGEGDDDLDGGDGNDDLEGGQGENTLTGGNGNDYMTGGDNRDSMTGGSGNDTLAGGSAADTLNGGDGDDTYVFALFMNDDEVTDSGGVDTLDFTSYSTTVTVDLVEGEAEDSIFGWTTEGLTEFENVYCGSGDDVITGGAKDNVLSGGEGNDSVSGGAGQDLLIDGLGVDTYAGGAGDDIYYFTTLNTSTVDTITDTSGSNRLVFKGFDTDDFIFRACDTDDNDYVDALSIYHVLGQWTIYVADYFADAYEDDDGTSGAGVLANIAFDDDAKISFSDLISDLIPS